MAKRWTENEYKLVALAYKRILTSGVTKNEAMIEAQYEILPANKRRPIPLSGSVHFRISNYLSAQPVSTNVFTKPVENIAPIFGTTVAVTKEIIGSLTKQQPNTPVALVPASTEKVSLSNLVVKEDKPFVVALPNIDQLITDHIKEQAKLFEEQYAAYIQEKVRTSVDKLCNDIMQKHNVGLHETIEKEFQTRLQAATPKETTTAIIIKQPKTVIVGLCGGQLDDVRKEYGHHLNLVFIDVDASMHQLKATCTNADHVFMMRKFISHRHTDVINKKNHKGFVLIQGGMTELHSSLLELACK